jgi:photosynthetic reaction center cytochrome c subunit
VLRLGPLLLIGAGVAFVVFVLFVPRWHAPLPGRQLGWRASSLVQFAPDPWQAARQDVPAPTLAAVPDDPRPASAVYRNVKVLNDVNAGDFMRLQAAMTAWVSPRQGCGYCHVAGDWASDAKPQKAAARVMLAMTRHINSTWSTHVGPQGVTCFSCHEGQPVPRDVWYQSPPRRTPTMVEPEEDWDEAARTVHAFFPNEGYEEYLLQDTPGLVQSQTDHPTKQSSNLVAVKRLYEMMMQMSDDIGVNCGFCHNSRAMFDWSQSTPNRWVGLGGIKLTRDINRNYIVGLSSILPLSRLRVDADQPWSLPRREQGWQAGNGLAGCATCHHGAPQPKVGVGLAARFPTLMAEPRTTAQTAPATPPGPPHG